MTSSLGREMITESMTNCATLRGTYQRAVFCCPYLFGFLLVRPIHSLDAVNGYGVNYVTFLLFFGLIALARRLADFFARPSPASSTYREWLRRLAVLGAGTSSLFALSLVKFKFQDIPLA